MKKTSLKAKKGLIIQSFLLLLPIFVLALVCIFRIDGPAYRSDEIAYLSSAASVAGKHNELASSWHKGYSLILSPFFRIVPSVLDAWPAVVLVNSLALGVSSICLWLSLQRTGVADRNLAFRLVLLGQLVFGSTAYIGWAFTNCLQTAVVSATCLIFSCSSFGRAQALGVGLILGFSTWLHPTGIPLIVAACLVSAIAKSSSASSRWRLSILVLLAALGMYTTYTHFIHPWINALQGGIKLNHYNKILVVAMQQLKDPSSAITILMVTITNSLASSAIASFGFAGAALSVIVHPWRSPRLSLPHGAELKRVILFLITSWGFLLILNLILPFTEPRNVALAFHHRYIQPVMPALVVFGMGLAPKRWLDRLCVWLFSAVPILLALLASIFIYNYEGYVNIIDLMGNVTLFVDPDLNRLNVQLMLLSGLIVTGFTQLIGWRAYVILAAGLGIVGWVRMDGMHREILRSGSRPPAMAQAASTLKSLGINSCVYLDNTPATPFEHELVMRYYLAGNDVSIFSGTDPFPKGCDILIRPVDSAISSNHQIPSGNRPDCKLVIIDTFAKQVLENCRNVDKYSTESIKRLLIPARRDLVLWEQVRQVRRIGERVTYINHWDDLIPSELSSDISPSWWKANKQPLSRIRVQAGNLLLEEPIISLPAGDYRAHFLGLTKLTVPVNVNVFSDNKSKTIQTWQPLKVSRSKDSFSFTLANPSQVVKITLIAAGKGFLVLPDFLVIFTNQKFTSSPWSNLP
jgi:hypothetical protein